MNRNQFYSELTQFLKHQDTDNANHVIMRELGNILVQDRDSFITLLVYSDVPASESDTDAQLIEAFIDNVNNNRRLLIGAAFLVNKKNRKVNFDGDEEISDTGVKAVHKVMYNYFNAYERDERHSNASGGWAGAIDSLGKAGGKALDLQNKKKNSGTDALAKKQEAKQKLIDSVLSQRKMQQAAAVKKQQEKDKLKKILIISGVSLASIALVIGGILIYKKYKG